MLKSPFISGAALESLTGKIFHWSQLNKLTKPLAFQCVQFIYNHIRKNKHLKNKIFKLNDTILMNLKFWLLAILTIQSSLISGLFKFWKIQHSIFTDAANFGIGIFDGASFGTRSLMERNSNLYPFMRKKI